MFYALALQNNNKQNAKKNVTDEERFGSFKFDEHLQSEDDEILAVDSPVDSQSTTSVGSNKINVTALNADEIGTVNPNTDAALPDAVSNAIAMSAVDAFNAKATKPKVVNADIAKSNAIANGLRADTRNAGAIPYDTNNPVSASPQASRATAVRSDANNTNISKTVSANNAKSKMVNSSIPRSDAITNDSFAPVTDNFVKPKFASASQARPSIVGTSTAKSGSVAIDIDKYPTRSEKYRVYLR